MSVKLRLARAGTHKRPFFWVVAADTRMPRDGRFLEKLGTFDPTATPSAISIKTERIHYWLDRGALPSEAVKEILRGQGILKERAGQAASKVEVSGEAAPAGETAPAEG